MNRFAIVEGKSGRLWFTVYAASSDAALHVMGQEIGSPHQTDGVYELTWSRGDWEWAVYRVDDDDLWAAAWTATGDDEAIVERLEECFCEYYFWADDKSPDEE
ncbi:MAG: hypothetical protein ABIJ57_00110 [Pseudomonadota bacterium]